jgi:hypothetical protein
MALVPCPECKAQVSRSATSCPQCGFPFGGATAMSTPLAAAAAAASLPPAKEELFWEGSPSLKALAVQMAATALFAIVVPIIVYLAYAPLRDLLTHASRDAADLVVEHEETARTVIVWGLVALVGSRVVRLAWRMLALRSQRYRISSQRITVESGVLSKTLAEIDVRTIDDITFHQSFVERLLGIGQIAILSSEPATPRAHLVGVPNPREVRELVRSSAYAATRGQLYTRNA